MVRNVLLAFLMHQPTSTPFAALRVYSGRVSLALLFACAACSGTYQSPSFGYSVRFPSGTVTPEKYEDDVGGLKVSIARVTGGEEVRLVVLAVKPRDGAFENPTREAKEAQKAFVASMVDGAHKFKCTRTTDANRPAGDETFSCPDYQRTGLRATFRGDATGLYLQIASYRPESSYSRENAERFFSSFELPKQRSPAPVALRSPVLIQPAIEQVLEML